MPSQADTPVSADSASSPVSLLYASAIDVLIREYGYKESDIHYYSGIMGVPITFLDKYNPEQFEILGATESEGKGFSAGLWIEESKVAQPLVDGERKYKRIFIRRKPHEN